METANIRTVVHGAPAFHRWDKVVIGRQRFDSAPVRSTIYLPDFLSLL